MRVVLAFLEHPGPVSYGRRLSRLRWKRAVAPSEVACLRPEDSARSSFETDGLWLVVTAAEALPLGTPGRRPERGWIVAVRAVGDAPAVHTLRELEGSAVPVAGSDAPTCALWFRPQEHPAGEEESVAAYLSRLLAARDRHDRDEGLAALLIDDPSVRERPELSSRVPAIARNLLDVGCGAAGTSAALKKKSLSLRVTGIERDPAAASRARNLLDRVVEGDACAELERMAAAGEAFDSFLFGDVLEHLADPVGALALARRVALPGATLVASVPNVGHLSFVRDLALGRFDPTPAGLADAGHLRWFDRRFLSEALEEAGWSVRSIEGEPGAPAPSAEEFLEKVASWPQLDRQSLLTYQWIAVARPAPPIGRSGQVRSGD